METGNWKLEAEKNAPRSYVRNAKDLEVYKLAYRVSLEIHNRSLLFPKIEQYGGIADQIRRATKSICANLSEGFSKQTQSAPEFRRFVSMAIGSSGEIQVWLDYCVDLGYIDAATHQTWSENYHSVFRMLHNLRSRTKT